MSNHSTSYTSTDGGQPPLITKLIDLSESDHGKTAPLQLPGNFPNIRRKKKVTKAERDRLLQTFEERSTYHHVNEVDLGFLERKRIVLKKKQELLNKTLLANKNNKQPKDATLPIAQAQEQRPVQLPVHRVTDLEIVKNDTSLNKNNTKNTSVSPVDGTQPKQQKQQQIKPSTPVDKNIPKITSLSSLPNETKTTINFNIYNAEIDQFKSKAGQPNDKPYKPQSSPMEEDSDKCSHDKPRLNKSQSINMESADERDEKDFNQDKFEKEAAKTAMSYLRNVLCCQTVFSIAIYIILFALIALSVLLALKTFHITKLFAHHDYHHHHDKNLHESKKKTIISNNATMTNITVPNNTTRNFTEHSQKPLKNNNDYNLQDFFATLSNATIERFKEQEQRIQLKDNTSLTNTTNKNPNEKRQNIPVPLIKVLITPTQAALSNTPQSAPQTTTTPTTTTPTTLATTPTTTVNPYIEAAKSVLATLNITGPQQQQLMSGFNAGSIDIGDSTTNRQNSPPVASMDQSPTYSSSSSAYQDDRYQQQQQQYYNQQQSPGMDDQNMLMDQSSLPLHQWNYDDNNGQYYDERNRLDGADGRSQIRQYDYPSQQQDNQDDRYRAFNDGNPNDLRNFDPFKDSDEERRDQHDDPINWNRRSDSQAGGDDIKTTSTTTTTTTPMSTTVKPTTTTSTTPQPPPPPPALPQSTTSPIPPTTTQQASPIQISPQDSQRPLVIAENVEQYMSPRILSHDPLENTDRSIHSDAVFTDQKQMEDDSEDDDGSDEDKDYHLSHQHKNFIPTRHARGNDYREIDNEEIKPFDKEMGRKSLDDDDDDGDDDDIIKYSRPHDRHLIPIAHNTDMNNDDDLKITVSKLKDSLADDLKDIKKKFSRLSQNKELEGVEKMIKILHHDEATGTDQATKSFHDLAKEDEVVKKDMDGPSDDMMTTLQQNHKADETGKNLMSLMLNEEKKLQSKDKPSPDLMNEFVAFEKAKTEKETSAKKRKNIPKKKKKSKPPPKKQVKTYKLKTCVQIKSFNPGVLVQIVKGPIKSNGKIRYDVRSCTRKRKKRQTKMTCEDITYRISTGRLMVKPVGWENAKKVYAVFGCKSDTNKGSMLMNQKSDEDVSDSDMMMGDDETNNNEHSNNDEDDDSDEKSSGSGSDDDNDGGDEDNNVSTATFCEFYSMSCWT